MKLQAFADRGDDDCLASRDFEDVVLLLDAREELGREIPALPTDALAFVGSQLRRLLSLPRFEYGLEGALGSRARASEVTRPRVEQLAAGS